MKDQFSPGKCSEYPSGSAGRWLLLTAGACCRATYLPCTSFMVRACGSDPSPLGIPSRSTATRVGENFGPGCPRSGRGQMTAAQQLLEQSPSVSTTRRTPLAFSRPALPPAVEQVRGCSHPRAPAWCWCEASLACRFSLSQHRFCAKLAPVLQFQQHFEDREQRHRQRDPRAGFIPF